MRVHSPRRVSHSPLAVAVGISLGLHLLVLAVALLVRAPSNSPTMKRGEPLFVELPQAEQPAERGAPAAPSSAPKAAPTPPVPPTPPAPPAVKAQPQPRVAATPPPPSPREARAAQPRAPEQTAAAPRSTAPETPAPDGQVPPAAAKPAEPMVNEPAPAPEPPREASPPQPQPRVAAVPPQPPQPPMIDSKAALRRGGPGGAGGAGEGWAGIEGEPIPLDSRDPKFNDYLDRIRRMIKEKWGYPCIKDPSTGHCDYKSARLVIVFGILKDGRVPMLEVAQQSGYDVYDDYAVNAIKLASPFPPVPASLMATAKSGSAGVKIVAAFQYVLVESSLTNILR